MEQPEVEPRNGIVIARIAQIQEAQQVLVDEIEPEEAVIFARNAAHRKIEIRRIAERRQHVPRRGNQQE